MGQKHRLGVLQVSTARHHRGLVRHRLRRDRVDEVDDQRRDAPGMVAQQHAGQRRDLVVTAPAGAQLAAELRPGAVDQPALERRVHVLVGRGRTERAVRHGLLQVVQGGEHPGEFLIRQITGLRQRGRMGPGAEDVVVGQLPVEVRRATQILQRVRRTGREAGTPEGAGFTGAVHHFVIRHGHCSVRSRQARPARTSLRGGR